MTEPADRAKSEDPVVHVIDDDPSVRAALEDLLASVGVASRSFASTQEYLATELPDAPGCLVLDIRMPGQSGLEFQRQMAELGIRLPVIFITGHGDIAITARSMKAGAIDFLAKPFDEQALLDAINQGVEKDRARRAREERLAEVQTLYRSLSSGERDVMGLIVQGLPNREIASRLNVSEITAKVRRGQLMRKMKAGSVPELVRAYDRLFPDRSTP